MSASSAAVTPRDLEKPETLASAQGEASTSVYLTIDAEYESGFTARHGAGSRDENFRRSILGETAQGAAGIRFQLDLFDMHGIKAVFFVDPMPGLLWGVEAVSDIVAPILSRGQDVQLHLHTEWLALAGAANPLGERTGENLKDFTLDEQCVLIDRARSILIAAGAPAPLAFRAGNYGANDDTLRALAQLGIAYDTSHSPGFAGSAGEIGLGPEILVPIRHCGVIEVPIGCIADVGGRARHAQLTALSKRELLAAIRHAHDTGAASFTVVSHSFELLSRDRGRINHILKRRFERFCARLAALEGVTTATYADDPPRVAEPGVAPQLLPPNVLRAGLRVTEQAAANMLYEERTPAGLAVAIAAAAATAAVAIE